MKRKKYPRNRTFNIDDALARESTQIEKEVNKLRRKLLKIIGHEEFKNFTMSIPNDKYFNLNSQKKYLQDKLNRLEQGENHE